MPIVNLKTSVAFPEIGTIRKGEPKSVVNNKPRIGADLGTKFRVDFAPGADNTASAKLFTQLFGDQPTRIPIMLPFPTLAECFDSWYEAYTAGRMIARADGEKYIRLVDHQTGQVLVNNGLPYKPFDPRQPVGWYTSSKGEKINIYAKPVSRLKVFIPALSRAAFLTLNTTSFYDAKHMQEQLNAVELLAKAINRGSVAGIPLVLTRRMTLITWVKPDGSAQRISKGLINIEVEPEYMAQIIGKLKSLGTGLAQPAPQLEAQIEEITKEEGEPDPGTDFEEFYGGEWNEEDGPQPEPEQAQPATPPPPATNGNGHGERPYLPHVVKEGLQGKLKSVTDEPVSEKQRNMLRYALEIPFIGSADSIETCRKTVSKYITGTTSTKDIDPKWVKVLLNFWLKPTQDSGGEYKVDPMAAKEANAIYYQAIQDAGQEVLPGLG